MKKKSFILSIIFMLVLGAFVSYGSERVRPIPNARLTIKTGELTTGDYLSDDATSYVSVSMDNQYYYLESAEWLDYTEQVAVGDQPRIKVYLNALPRETSTSHTITTYLFRGTYNSSNVYVTGGEFISAAVRDSGYTLEVTIRVNAVKGTYDVPTEAYWSSAKGTAIWQGSDNSSGYYDLICYRGSRVVKRLNNFQGTTYTFYPYMTKEGDYTFRVRSVAPPNVSTSIGKHSEWTESNILTIGANEVSDGTGQTTLDENGGSSANSFVSGNINAEGTGNSTVAGWVQQGATWYFRYPNGQLATNCWLQLNGKNYMFDASGRMVTGWAQDSRGLWYYMDKNTGAMRTGWLNDNGKWYFLNTTKDSFEGSMLYNIMWNYNGQTYYFNQDGVMVTGWYQINGNWYYFYPEGSTGGAYGYLARDTVINGVFYVDGNGVWAQSGKL